MIFENVLPILHSLKHRYPGSKVYSFFPKGFFSAYKVYKKNCYLISHGFPDLLDDFVVRSPIGWLKLNQTLLSKLFNVKMTYFIDKVTEVLDKRSAQFDPFSKFLCKAIFFALKGSLSIVGFSLPNDSEHILLCDASEQDTLVNKLLISYIKPTKIICITHGLGIDHVDSSIELNSSWLYPYSPNYFLCFSPSQLQYLNSSYAYPNAIFVKSPIPRLESSWLHQQSHNFPSQNLSSSIPHIVVVGRPSSLSRNPLDQKLDAFYSLLEISIEFGYPILIKPHPKEDIAIYSNFIESHPSINCQITDLPWNVLSSNCLFALTFGSSVSYELAYYGIPSLEWVDLGKFGVSSELLCNDYYNFFGEKVIAARYDNVSITVRSYTSLLHFILLLKNPDFKHRISNAFRKRFDSLFFNQQSVPSLDTIIDRIMQ